MSTVKPVRIRSTIRAYEGLRRILVESQISPGKRLAEAEWADRLGTSRPAVREAFAMLAHEELLSRGERGGFFVAKYSAEDLHKFVQARLVIETGALRLLETIDLDQELLDHMVEYCQTMDYLLDHEILLGFAEIDRNFHTTLVDLAGNEWLAKIHHRTPLSRFFSEIDMAAIREMGLEIIREHREIHRAICERRIDDAVAVLQKHLTPVGLRSMRAESAARG